MYGWKLLRGKTKCWSVVSSVVNSHIQILYLGNRITDILIRIKCVGVQKAANSDIYLSRFSYIKRKNNTIQLWANAERHIYLEKQYFGLETGQIFWIFGIIHQQHQMLRNDALSYQGNRDMILSSIRSFYSDELNACNLIDNSPKNNSKMCQ